MIEIKVGVAGVEWGRTSTLLAVEGIEEFDPELVFMACNRIGGDEGQDHLCVDLMRLMVRCDAGGFEMFDAMRSLRTQLEDKGAPSMSVGDLVRITSQSGAFTAVYRCEPFGWVTNPEVDAEWEVV